jgi:hypothetical protein
MAAPDFNLILDAIQNSGLAESVSKSNHLVGALLQVVHILGFVLLLASLVLVSLRLLGAILVEQPVARIAREAWRLSWLGFALALVSGILMFIATPRLYVGNWAFQLKLLLFVVAALYQITWFRRLAGGPGRSLVVVRLSVAATLILWFGVGFAGRMIGFV